MNNQNPTQAIKLPPHSLESEQSVIGGLLLDNTAWEKCADIIGEHDFYRHDHRVIYRHINALIELNRPADVVTVSEQLENAGELANVGGLAYLGALAKNTPSIANIRHYAEIVRERSLKRHLAAACMEIADDAYSLQGRNAREMLDEAESKIFAIAEIGARTTAGPKPIQAILGDAIHRIDELFHSDNQSGLTGVPTGITELDNLTSGLQAGDLVIIAGRPSMGKTAFAINIAENAAIKENLPVAVFSLEMGEGQIANRLLSSVGRISQSRLRSGKLIDEDWPKLTHATAKLNETDIHIDETPALTALEVRARARRLHRQHGKLGLIVIDYLQLMSSPVMRSRDENRATEISDISRSLKALAKELSVPVVALSQLNRGLETRTNKRPIMSDLRESGAIEQDADLILFIYRDEVYHPESEDKGTAEIIIGKQRNGPIGMVRTTFIDEYTRFQNHSRGNY